MKSHSDSEYGYFWGYGTKNNGVDLPQRFGDEAFYILTGATPKYAIHGKT